MLIFEVQAGPDLQKLTALAEFLLSRAKDTDSQKKISVETFLQLAHDQGVSLSRDQLESLYARPPLDSLIQDIQNDEIIFKGSESAPAQMSVDQARKTVDQMAKRAATKATSSQ